MRTSAAIIDEVVIRVVDANSQFTRELKATDNPFSFQSPTVRRMVEKNILRCGHYVFGNRHNLLGVVVADGAAEFVQGVGDDFSKKLRFFATEVFAEAAAEMIHWGVLIYPLESSASSLISRLEEQMPKEDRRFGLAKAFHEGSQYQHGFEPDIDGVLTASARSGRLLLIVFDDSRSSGETERRAVQTVSDAFAAALPEADVKSQLAVFSYAVVNRLRDPSTALERSKLPNTNCEVATRREQFFVMPHQSTDENNCRICVGERRAHIGLAGLGDGYNDLVGKHTRDFVDFVRRKHADASDLHIKDYKFLPELTWRLFQLHTTELPEICYRFRDPVHLNPSESATLLVHLASHYGDARAFLAEHVFIELLLGTLGNAADADPVELSYFSFFLAVAILPIDLSCQLFEHPRFYQIAVKLSSGQMASIILFLLRTHYFALANTLAAVEAAKAEHRIGKRQIQLVGRILLHLEELRTSLPEGADQKAADLESLKAKILALSGHAGTRSPVNLARLIGIRMFDGPHASYAKALLENQDAAACLDGPAVGLHVLSSMRDFCRMVSSPHERRLGEIAGQYQAQARKVLEERTRTNDHHGLVAFNRQLLTVLEGFWHKERIVQDHLHSLASLQTLIDDSRTLLRSDPNLIGSVITDKLNKYISVEGVVEGEQKWRVLGPSKNQLGDLIRNLLLNPFVHYNEEIESTAIPGRARLFDSMATSPGRHVQVTVRFKVDLEVQRLLLAVGDNAKPAKVEKVELGQKGLGNSHLYLATVDCTLDIFRVSKGSLVASKGGLARQIAKALGTQFARHNNVFVVTMPLVFKGSS